MRHYSLSQGSGLVYQSGRRPRGGFLSQRKVKMRIQACGCGGRVVRICARHVSTVVSHEAHYVRHILGPLTSSSLITHCSSQPRHRWDWFRLTHIKGANPQAWARPFTSINDDSLSLGTRNSIQLRRHRRIRRYASWSESTSMVPHSNRPS